MLFRNFIFCTTSIVTVCLIVEQFFVKNENFSRYTVITYNKFQPTIKVENSGLSNWGHNEGELLQKIVFFCLTWLYQLALLIVRELITSYTCRGRSGLRIEMHLWLLQIKIWRWSIFFVEFFTVFKFVKYYQHIFRGGLLCTGLPYIYIFLTLRLLKNSEKSVTFLETGCTSMWTLKKWELLSRYFIVLH